MKLKKITFLFFAFILIALPFGSFKAFAAITSGWTSPTITSGNAVNQNSSVDSNLSTKAQLQGNSTTTYSIPLGSTTVNLWIAADGSGLATGKIAFSTGTGGVSWTVSGTSAVEKTVSIPSGATWMTVSSTSGASGASYYGFDLFEIEVGSNITHDDITGLASSVSGTSATLNYSIPSSNSAFTGSKIYRNGTLIATLGKSVNTYTDKNLSYNNSYTYKVTATYSDGYETNGQTTTVNTNVTHTDISNLTNTVNQNSITLNFTVPTNNTNYTGFNVYRNGTFIGSGGSAATSFTDTNAPYNTSDTYKVTATYSDGYETAGQTTTGAINFNHDEISGLTSSANQNSITVNFTAPSSNPYYSGASVYRNGSLIAKLDSSSTSYTDTKANYNTNYNYKVTSNYVDGYETAGQTTTGAINFNHDEISGLTSSVNQNSVTLNFTAPSKNPYYTGANVYRNGTLIGTLGTQDNSFVDSNVSYSTKMNYKVTANYVDGYETAGQTLSVNTPAEPVPVFQGTFTQNSSGDYVVSWTQPTTGTVKILMAGQTLTTVPASTGTYTIPKANMKYTAIGSPDVTVQPISSSGLVGNKVSWPQQQLKTPFNVTDLIQSGNGLFFVIAPFVLLALSFLLVPKLRRLLFSTLKRFRTGKDEKPGRRTKDDTKGNEDPRERGEPREPGTRTDREPRTEKESHELNANSSRLRKNEREPRAARTINEAAAINERTPRRIRVSRNELRSTRETRERETRRIREARESRIPRERRGN